MGWTAYYQILRDRPLVDDELAALDDFIERHNRPPWECESFGLAVTREARADHVLGHGWQKLPSSLDEAEDPGRLCGVLTELLDLIPGVEVRVSDDFNVFGWDPDARRFTLEDDPGPDLVELDDDGAFAAPGSLLPSRHRPLPPEVEAFVAGAPATPAVLEAALLAHAGLTDGHPAAEALTARLAAAPREDLARAGLAGYRELYRSWGTWDLVDAALVALDDVRPIVPAFLAVWREPHGLYWYGDMRFADRALDALAREPAVEEQLLADLAASVGEASSELTHRRAEHAARLLGRARTRTATLALLDAARTLRDDGASSNQRYHTRPGVLAGLAATGVPAIVPTFLLELGAGAPLLRAVRDALPTIARLAPDRIRPLLLALARVPDARRDAGDALAAVGAAPEPDDPPRHHAMDWPRLTPASADALRAEEAAIRDAIAAGRLDPGAPTEGAVPPAPVELAPEAAAAPPEPARPPVRPATPGPAPAPAPAGADADVLDDLLTTIAHEHAPDAALIARAGLPADVATMDRYDRARALRERVIAVGPATVGARLIDRLAELHESYALGELCEQTLPEAARDPDHARRLADLWDDAHATPWSSTNRVTSLLEPVAATPPLFARVVEELGAPDDGALRSRTDSAFALIAAAKTRRDEATAVVVARIVADRGRPRDVVAWRADAYRALRRLGAEEAVPTAILELAELASMSRASNLLELLAADQRGIEVLVQAIDLPELAADAAKELCRSRWVADDLRNDYHQHPYWKVRLAAADAARSWDHARLEMFGVWAAIDRAGLPVPDDAREAARPSDAPPDATWDDLARPYGRPLDLPLPPPPRDGLASPCADHRRWALWACDERPDPADAVARVLADELDRAMVARGHQRGAPRWPRWRAVVPDLPADRVGRLAWARAQRDAALPPALARVRDDGADAVAAELPGPCLALSAERRAELEALERPVAARGAAILRDGPGEPPPEPAKPPPPRRGPAPFF